MEYNSTVMQAVGVGPRLETGSRRESVIVHHPRLRRGSMGDVWREGQRNSRTLDVRVPFSSAEVMRVGGGELRERDEKSG